MNKQIDGTPYAKAITFCCLFWIFWMVGCGLQSSIFQTKIPPPIEKTAAQLEAERQSADLIAKGIKTPVSLQPVARELSDSLGRPDKPLPSSTPEQVDSSALIALDRLEAGMAKMQKQLDTQNKFIAKYQGKELEGTGFNLAGPGFTAIILGLIVLSVACPPVMTLMFFAFRRLKAAAGIVVNEVEKAGNSPEAKEAVNAIKASIAAKMQAHPQKTTLLKGVISNLKT